MDMKEKRGKEVPENPDRGVKLCQVRLLCSNEFQLNFNLFSFQFIAVVCKVKESHHNLKTLFDLLRLEEQREIKLVFDLKAANLASGVQNARAR